MCPFLFNIISISYLFIMVPSKGVFVCTGIIFGCDDTTYNPSYIWVFSLLTQSSGLTTLVYLSCHEKDCKGVDQSWLCL